MGFLGKAKAGLALAVLLVAWVLVLQIIEPAALQQGRALMETHAAMLGLPDTGSEGAGADAMLAQGAADVVQHQQSSSGSSSSSSFLGGGGGGSGSSFGSRLWSHLLLQHRLDPQQQQQQGGAAAAAPEFVGYQPSAWEREWVAAAEAIQADPLAVCATMLKDVERSKAWVDSTSLGGHLQFTQEGGSLALDPDVFSRFTYRDPRTGEEYGVWIEPLVGHFRHPYNPAACVPPGMPPLDIQDRGYLLLHGLTPEQFDRLYPGKKYLLDLGTATFGSSLGWFVDHYGEWGVEFDEVWAWELEHKDPQEYWAEVPRALRSKLHFYNIPVTIDASDADNPINIIKGKYRPGDFVVVKLDIDNAPLEHQLIEQIRGDPEAIKMIAEMGFEAHYDSWDMSLAFGHPNATWLDVAQLFWDLRARGLRLHYWP